MSSAQHPTVDPWQLGFQEAVTPVMEQLSFLHDGLTLAMVAVVIFVLLLLVMVIFKFREDKNPVPSKVTHNTKLEIAWTVIPILILVAISIPSLRVHYFMDKAAEPDMVLKVTGYQWYWNYIYPDNGDIAFDSYMIKEEDLKEGDVRLLSVDNPIVVPVNKTVAVHVTGGDVIHSFAMPAFGIKTDAVPGRKNETWFKATKEGVYFGQCSELCGVGHGFMPIEIHVVSENVFRIWAANTAAALAGAGTYNSRAVLQEVEAMQPAVIDAEIIKLDNEAAKAQALLDEAEALKAEAKIVEVQAEIISEESQKVSDAAANAKQVATEANAEIEKAKQEIDNAGKAEPEGKAAPAEPVADVNDSEKAESTETKDPADADVMKKSEEAEPKTDKAGESN